MMKRLNNDYQFTNDMKGNIGKLESDACLSKSFDIMERKAEVVLWPSKRQVDHVLRVNGRT